MNSDATTVAGDRSSEGRRWLNVRWVSYVALGILLSIYLGLNQAIGTRHHFPTWQPFVWEISSVILVFALIPLIVRFENRFRIDSRPRTRAALHPHRRRSCILRNPYNRHGVAAQARLLDDERLV